MGVAVAASYAHLLTLVSPVHTIIAPRPTVRAVPGAETRCERRRDVVGTVAVTSGFVTSW